LRFITKHADKAVNFEFYTFYEFRFGRYNSFALLTKNGNVVSSGEISYAYSQAVLWHSFFCLSDLLNRV